MTLSKLQLGLFRISKACPKCTDSSGCPRSTDLNPKVLLQNQFQALGLVNAVSILPLPCGPPIKVLGNSGSRNTQSEPANE